MLRERARRRLRDTRVQTANPTTQPYQPYLHRRPRRARDPDPLSRARRTRTPLRQHGFPTGDVIDYHWVWRTLASSSVLSTPIPAAGAPERTDVPWRIPENGRGTHPFIAALAREPVNSRAPAGQRPVVVLKPAPQRIDRIFGEAALQRLRDHYEVVNLENDPTEAALEVALPRAFAIVGQPDLPAARLNRAPQLRAVLNVEGNFFPNVDYETCFRNGVQVLGCGPAYAQAVAQYSLWLAIDLARGISREDRAFRAGRERYVSAGNADAILLRHSDIGLLGYGNLGVALHRLLVPFGATIRVYDPWLPDSALRDSDLRPAPLDELLSRSTFLFVLATVTADSERLLGPRELDLLRPNARLVLVSRAAVVDFEGLLVRVAGGRFVAAVDVWPAEPVAEDDPARRLEGLVLSAHRAGGIPQAFFEIGEMVVDDLEQIRRGLPPARMQVAARELVGRYRNRPVA